MGTPRFASVDSDTLQFPDSVRDVQAANLVDPAQPEGAALGTVYTPKWKPTTAYTAGQIVVSPTGDLVSAKTTHTSGATFSGTGAGGNWNLSSSYEPAGLVAATKAGLLPLWKATTAYTVGQQVVTPAGDIATCATAHTSGASFAWTNWKPTPSLAPISVRGTYSARPAATTVFTGTVYYATDVLEAYVATGTPGGFATAWSVLPGGSQIGYAEITSNWSTGTVTTWVPVPGLSSTVTVGERPIVVSLVGLLQSTTAADVNVSIFEDGVEISRFNSTTSAANQYRTATTSRRRGLLTPGSSHTYDARVFNQTGQSIVLAATTSAASLEVRTV